MDITAVLNHLESQPTYNGQIAHVEHIPYREASYAELDELLVGELQDCLNEHGLSPLYRHQAEAAQAQNPRASARDPQLSVAATCGPRK